MAIPVTKEDFKARLAQCGFLSYEDSVLLFNSILFYADVFKKVQTYAAMVAIGKPAVGITIFKVAKDETHGSYENAVYLWYADNTLLWVAATTINI